jgi:hypoxanthine phosphoribosyltransferase
MFSGMEPRFAHPVERELARIFDEIGIAWEYEPTTFVLERNEDGTVKEAFTPDFYLPEQDIYVECTTMQQRLTSRKNRKLRRLRERGVLVTVLYRRDFERLRDRHGIPFDLAA